jgi:glutamate/aspartate transport system substrate-binding protein
MLPRGDWAFRLAVNTALAHVFRSGEILGLYTKYLGGVGLGVSNWAGVVFAGTTNARAVRDQLARRNLSATLVEFRDRREGIAALARGDLDGFASDKFVLLALARAESLRDFTLLPDDLSFEPFAIMLPRGDWAFRLAVNTALAHVFRSGEILGLYTKYLGGVGLGVSNWAGVVFMFGGLPE